MRKYRISFDIWGLLLFLLLMIPSVIWFAVPAPQDILRNESTTEWLDTAASLSQILCAAALCVIVHTERKALRLTPAILSSIGCGLLYYAGWILYYHGHTHPLIILLLTVPPCFTLLLFAIDRKNYIAVVPAAMFTVCHLIHSIANFMIR